jgi:hypothetical protein
MTIKRMETISSDFPSAAPPGRCRTASEYTCTSPGPRNRISIKIKPTTVGAAIHRHGSVRLRIVLRMVNASGKRTTLRRTVTVTRG